MSDEVNVGIHDLDDLIIYMNDLGAEVDIVNRVINMIYDDLIGGKYDVVFNSKTAASVCGAFTLAIGDVDKFSMGVDEIVEKIYKFISTLIAKVCTNAVESIGERYVARYYVLDKCRNIDIQIFGNIE